MLLEFSPNLALGKTTIKFLHKKILLFYIFFWADIYSFRTLADVERDFFKGFQTIHNRKSIHQKNNFITGTTSTKNKEDIVEETVQIRLMPHQVFIFPKTWIFRITNGDELTTAGLSYYDDEHIT